MRFGVVLTVASFFWGAGCIQETLEDVVPPVHHWGGGSCDAVPKANLTIDVTGPSTLREIRLVAHATIRPMLSCVGPVAETTIPGDSSSFVIDAQSYPEIDLLFEDRVVRAWANLSLVHDGVLRVRIDASHEATPRIRWNGSDVAVERYGVSYDPKSLEPHRTYHVAPLDGAFNHSFPVRVNWSWNQGLEAIVSVEWDYEHFPHAPNPFPSMPGGWLALRVYGPEGQLVEERVLPQSERSIRVVRTELREGDWRVEVAGREPAELEHGHYNVATSVNLVY